MLKSWLGSLSLETFVATYIGKSAWATPGRAEDMRPLFGWSTLSRLLAARDLDLLVVSGGRLRNVERPRSLDEARTLMRQGLGFVIRRAQRLDPALDALARSFVHDLPGEPQVQLFVTPGGTHGFGWHYDLEDVFIAQTEGIKDYYFRKNTVTPQVPTAGPLDFEPFRRERSPLQTARLVPGDALYIPSRWWHMARCLEDSLSISIGVRRTDPFLAD